MTFYIEKISLTQFRNYTALRLSGLEDKKINVLIGPNGAGKTNILESMSLLNPGRGIRQAKNNDLKNINATSHEYWAIVASIHTPDGLVQVGTGQTPDKSSRTIRINGIDQSSQSSLAEISAIIWLIPQMDGLFLGSPSDRRKFLDRMVSNFDPKHTSRTNKYTKLIRERAQILKTYASRADTTWLDNIEAQIASEGIAIAAARHTFCERMTHAIERLNINEKDFPKPVINVSGTVDDYLRDNPAVESEMFFRETLKRTRDIDTHIGGAQEGTHKSDFKVRHKTLGIPAENCSTGEQKGLLINLILAQASLVKAERGFAPILLLDDIAAFLDEDKRKVLFDTVMNLECQCWMSGTDIDDFIHLKNKARFFEIQNSIVTEQD